MLRLFTAEQIRKLADFESPEELQTRLETLAENANEGELPSDERTEHEGCVRANHFIAVRHAKARRHLAAQASC